MSELKENDFFQKMATGFAGVAKAEEKQAEANLKQGDANEKHSVATDNTAQEMGKLRSDFMKVREEQKANRSKIAEPVSSHGNVPNTTAPPTAFTSAFGNAPDAAAPTAFTSTFVNAPDVVAGSTVVKAGSRCCHCPQEPIWFRHRAGSRCCDCPPEQI